MLQVLGHATTEDGKRREVPAHRLVAAQEAVAGSPLGDLAAGGRQFAPVLDGEVVPCDPSAPEVPIGSASVPLLTRSTRDELTFFTCGTPAPDGLDDGVAAKMANKMSGGDTLYECYHSTRPAESAQELLGAVMTDGLRVESIIIAERKVALVEIGRGSRTSSCKAAVGVLFCGPTAGLRRSSSRRRTASVEDHPPSPR